MLRTYVVLVVAFCVLCAPLCAHPRHGASTKRGGLRDGPMTISGVELGVPMKLPECYFANDGSSPARYLYYFEDGYKDYRPCFRHVATYSDDNKGTPANPAERVYLDVKDLPVLGSGKVSAFLKDGRIEKIHIETGGQEFQAVALKALVAKYGAA